MTEFVIFGLSMLSALQCVASFNPGFFRTFHKGHDDTGDVVSMTQTKTRFQDSLLKEQNVDSADENGMDNVIFDRPYFQMFPDSPPYGQHMQSAGANSGQMADNACQICKTLKRDYIYKMCVIRHCSKVD